MSISQAQSQALMIITCLSNLETLELVQSQNATPANDKLIGLQKRLLGSELDRLNASITEILDKGLSHGRVEDITG